MINLKTAKDIAHMRQGGRILARVLDAVLGMVQPGVSTGELNSFAQQLIEKAGCKPAFKGYRQQKSDPPYPDTLCTSINSEVVHGIASRNIILKQGDIIGIDIGLFYPTDVRTYVLDMAKTVGVGKISKTARKLLRTTERALGQGIKAIRPGGYVHDISKAIETTLTKEGLGVVRDLVGHGVGFELHEDPCVYNYVTRNMERVKLEVGMVLALEPMATLGGHKVRVAKDGWTIETRDTSLAAQFEHTVAVVPEGFEILTLI